MHRFDIFLMFSIILRHRIIDFTVFGHVRTYVRTSRQKSGHMSGRPDKSPDICLDVQTKVRILSGRSDKSPDICLDVQTKVQTSECLDVQTKVRTSVWTPRHENRIASGTSFKYLSSPRRTNAITVLVVRCTNSDSIAQLSNPQWADSLRRQTAVESPRSWRNIFAVLWRRVGSSIRCSPSELNVRALQTDADRIKKVVIWASGSKGGSWTQSGAVFWRVIGSP